jgi:hypothetical protein
MYQTINVLCIFFFPIIFFLICLFFIILWQIFEILGEAVENHGFPLWLTVWWWSMRNTKFGTANFRHRVPHVLMYFFLKIIDQYNKHCLVGQFASVKGFLSLICLNVLVIIAVAMVTWKQVIWFLYAALWKRCTETKNRSLIHSLLCICTSIQRSKSDDCVLTLHSFYKWSKIRWPIDFSCYILLCYFFNTNVIFKCCCRLSVILTGNFLACCTGLFFFFFSV